MTASLNDLTCTEVRVTLPRYGVWHAVASLEDAEALPVTPGGVTLDVAGLSLVGTVVDQGDRSGLRTVEIVGGYGGWRRRAPAQGHRLGNAVKLSDFARSLATAQGEIVVVDPALDRPLGQIVARLGSMDAASLLTHACASPPGSAVVPWWVAPDGTTRLEARQGAAFDLEEVDRDDLDRWRAYASDDATGALPGSTVAGRVVEELRVSAAGDVVRLMVTLGDIAPAPGETGQTIAEGLRRVVLRVLGAHVSASRIYRYRVTGILGDGRYTAKPLRSILAPDLDGLSLWPGIGGGRTRPATDCVILVQFADGDIGFPVVVGFQPGIAGTPGLPTVTELDGVRVNIGDGATGELIARRTDVVRDGAITVGPDSVATANTLVVAFWPFGAVAPTSTLTLVATGLTVSAGGAPGVPIGTLTMTGVINEVGNTKSYV